MRIGKLYIKIFLYFIATLVVAELLVFGAFGLFFKKRWESRFRIRDVAGAQALLLRESVEMRLGVKKPSRGSISPRELVREYAKLYGARVWIMRDGRLVAHSGSGPVPDFPTEFTKDFGHFAIGRDRHDRYMLRLKIRLNENGRGDMYFSLLRKTDPHPSGFVLGLLGIGLAFTFLLFPVSRMIGKPIRELRDSALRIAKGELTHRAAVRGSDEIGELGRSFNFMAEQTERMIRGARELTAHVSHELRSPLARIRVAEELLREKVLASERAADPGEATRLLDSIRGEITDLDELIGRILTLSKLDLRPDTAARPALDPNEILTRVIARFEPALEKRGLKLRLLTEETFGLLPLDGDALQAAFSNVMDNALKYTEPAGEITVRTSRQGDDAVFEFRNTCRPPTHDELEKILEPFYRGANSMQSFADDASDTPPPPAGSGLGLAITGKIIELHGGRISATTSETEFSLRLSLPLSSSV